MRMARFRVPCRAAINAIKSIVGASTRAAVLVILLCASAGCAPEPTAIIVTSINDPVRVAGGDDMEHIEYDLVITNVFYAPVTITSIDVATPKGKRLLRLRGDDLKEALQPMMSAGEINEIPASGSAAVLIDVIVPRGELPAEVTHLIKYETSPTPLESIIGSKQILGPRLTVSNIEPLVISSPLKGDGWFNANGCCVASAHRSFRIVSGGGRFVKPETFAIDWVRLKDNQLFEGDGSENDQYFGYGADVHSVADGTVITTRNDMPDTPPNTPPVLIGPNDYSGNHVIVLIEPGVWAYYVHLIPGSVTVKEGDAVAKGQVLGKLGSTGNSTAPHLHFGLGDGPDILTSNSLPFVMDRYKYLGMVHVNTPEEEEKTGVPIVIESPDGGPRIQRNALPLNFAVTDFD